MFHNIVSISNHCKGDKENDYFIGHWSPIMCQANSSLKKLVINVFFFFL